jgi:glucosyl-dolichyl phosphate glucuronosyltransferase
MEGRSHGAIGAGSTSPLVTVVVATRNRRTYLEECLASLSAQRCEASFEVVVVDNGSNDGTADLLATWCRADPRFRTVREERAGLSIAKNRGVAAARGSLLAFTDDDVILEPGWVAAHVAASEEGRARRIVGGRVTPVPSDLGPWPAWVSSAVLEDIGLLDHGAGGVVTAVRYVWGANMSMPRFVFDECGPWNETVGRREDQRGTFEDTEYQDRARLRGVDIWFTPDATLRHRVDRATVTPRMSISTAFARSAAEIRIERDRLQDHVQRARAVRIVPAMLRVGTLVAWELTLRVVPTARVFARAHRAAEGAGRAVERFDPLFPGVRGRGWHARIGRALRRTTWRSRHLVPDRRWSS